jgi:nicotinate-nucleotide adenylyltransferase
LVKEKAILMRIALFGGSFDPPHFGHKKIVEQAVQNLDIQTLIVMPTFLNPFKETSHFSAQERLQMCKEQFLEFSEVLIDDFEINEQREVPTIETVNYLFETYDIEKLYVIIGADNLKKLHLWKDYQSLEKKVEFVVATRDGIKIDSKYKQLNIQCDISSTEIRKQLDTI